MTTEFLNYPALTEHRQFARLPSHFGAVRVGEATHSGSAEFLLPASGQAIAAFHTSERLDTQDFGADLVIEGSTEASSFRIVCPTCYVRHQSHSASGLGGWSLISPVNGPARVGYGNPRPVSVAVVLLNNFDYRCGDSVTNDRGFTRIGTPLGADLGKRRVTFRHRLDYDEVQPLVRAGVLPTASLTEFTFDVKLEESDEEVMAFAADVAALCTVAAGSGVGVAMISLLDGDDAAVRRVIPQPVESRHRRNDIIDDFDLPPFFQATFDEYITMTKAHAPWRKLASYCGSLEDAPYLEEKFASLIMALEFFTRNCLIEQGQNGQQVTKLDFLEVMGSARKHLGWDLPQHYMTKQTIRVWRNAVMHGGELPQSESAAFRLLFDKWRLFLFRRVLIRLGYQGKVLSPHKGWRSSSDVADFSEEHNSFLPADPETDPWSRFVKKLREHQAPGAAGS